MGQGATGNLQAVEHERGGAIVDELSSHGAQDIRCGDLDGIAVLEHGNLQRVQQGGRCLIEEFAIEGVAGVEFVSRSAVHDALGSSNVSAVNHCSTLAVTNVE